jgi:superfamily II DNA or RNA helicase
VPEQLPSEFSRLYDLVKARRGPSTRKPAPHQKKALDTLKAWSEKNHKPFRAGSILVLPTGGGKTFTAVRFLCTGPISHGYKVLWLAHTHHLLDQALHNFDSEVSGISGPKSELKIRVVSGGTGYFLVSGIKPDDDDIVIATLQTITQAYKVKHPQLIKFLASAQAKLFVIFDEAHHAPAPSYFKLITSLFEAYPSMYLLGLTATPRYTDEKKQGRLKELFPQGIISQVSPTELMAARILAKPIFEEHRTDLEVEFPEDEYKKWVNSYQGDLPEYIIRRLADNRSRNAFIADTYYQHKERYGKTIIFADRIEQCEQLRNFLARKSGVRADVIYSYVDLGGGSKRDKDENARVLEKFRQGGLDVIVNVRMLTEGTDVPDVDTIFLTRQTTSQILMTQMVGRALRGPEFGGTENAYIVSFIDNWKHLINWAEYDPLEETPIPPDKIKNGKRPPLQLISISLIRRLLDEMNKGVQGRTAPFLEFLPIGWYSVTFATLVDGSENNETIRLLLMVFEQEKEGYERFINHLKGENIEEFEDEYFRIDDCQTRLNGWQERFFSGIDEPIGIDRLINLFYITCHIAQNHELPVFFYFEDREKHNLDNLAQEFIDKNIGVAEIEQRLHPEYEREDRYWKVFYSKYGMFAWEFMACIWFKQHGKPAEKSKPSYELPETLPADLSEEMKKIVKERDGYRCLCCAEDQRFRLQVDHIKSRYYGVDHSLANLQTLCGICNGTKGRETINFQNHKTLLTSPPSEFREFTLPQNIKVHNNKEWEKFLRRSFNFFYQCTAVESIVLFGSEKFCYWQINLFQENKPIWVKPHLENLVKRIREAQINADVSPLAGLKVKVSSQSEEEMYFEYSPPIKPQNNFSSTSKQLVPEDSLSSTKNKLTRRQSLSVLDGTLCRFEYRGKLYEGKISNGEIIISQKGSFSSFSTASGAIVGYPRNGWLDWELQLPGTNFWIKADDWRKSAESNKR